MIIYKDSIVKLDYNPATDIVEIEYPDLYDFLIPQIMHSIDALVDSIKSYDVSRVLLDSTRTVIDIPSNESMKVANYLAAGLVKTRVQKLARVRSLNSTVEQTAENNIRNINDSMHLPFQLQNFTSKPEALAWLVER